MFSNQLKLFTFDLNIENNLDNAHSEIMKRKEEMSNDIPSGVSMENASYVENNINEVQENVMNDLH